MSSRLFSRHEAVDKKRGPERTRLATLPRSCLGGIASVVAIAAGCGSSEPDRSASVSGSGADQHRVPDEMMSLRASYITSVQAEASPEFAPKRVGHVLQARNRTQEMVAEFAESGVSIRSDERDAAWDLALSAERFGCASDPRSLGRSLPRAAGARVAFERATENGPPIVEWYVNGPLGLEQGFEIPSAPACRSGSAAELAIDVALRGGLRASTTKEGDAVVFLDEAGKALARYGDLSVRDATGRMLPSHLAVTGNAIRIAFDATGARYPLAVDPLIATQQAKLLAGEGRAQDSLGTSTAVSGNIAVLGAPEDATKGVGAGAAYVFTRTGAVWTQEAKLVAPDGDSGDAFGGSVAISGTTIVVGARNDELGGVLSGSAYVFIRDGVTWTQQAKLLGSGETAGDEFGGAVAISGDTIVVGANRDAELALDAGSAYVFGRTGTTWAQQAKVFPDAAATAFYGTSVAVSGDMVVVGAPDSALGGPGAAYVLFRTGTTWRFGMKLLPLVNQPGNQYGASVAASGNLVLIGAPGSGTARQGAAFLWEHTAPDAWTGYPAFLPTKASPGDHFGGSVAISGDVAVVASTTSDITDISREAGALSVIFWRGPRRGTTQVFQGAVVPGSGNLAGASVATDGNVLVVGSPRSSLQGTRSGAGFALAPDALGFFANQQTLLTAEGEAGDRLGSAIAVAGDTAVVGAPGDNTRGQDAGAAYVFTRTGTTWTRLAKLLASDGATNAIFGSAVALAGDVLAIGAPRTSDALPSAGAIYVFTRDGATWTERTKLRASNPMAEALFGAAVATSGTTIVVGAPSADVVAGAVYVFAGSGPSWSEEARLTAADAAQFRRFGSAVAIARDTIVAGSPGSGSKGTDQGTMEVFVREAGAWTRQARLAVPTTSPGGAFCGTSVALSGDTAAMGCTEDSDGADFIGSVAIFTRTATEWSLPSKVFGSDRRGGTRFGASLALEGDTMLVGAVATIAQVGSAYVFRRSAATWTQDSKIADVRPFVADAFGAQVALSGGTAFVGAPSDTDQGTSAGAAYAFVLGESGPIP